MSMQPGEGSRERSTLALAVLGSIALHALGAGAILMTSAILSPPSADRADSSRALLDVDEVRIGARASQAVPQESGEPAPPALPAAPDAAAPVATSPLAAASAPPANGARDAVGPRGVAPDIVAHLDGQERTVTRGEYQRWVRAHNGAPEYPRASNQAHEQGRVVVRILVSPAGRLEQLDLETSSGFDRLDRAVMETVRGWAFPPFTGPADAPRLELRVPFRFELYN